MLFKVILILFIIQLTLFSVIIMKTNSFIALIFFSNSGNTTVDELMMRLMGAMEIFTAQQQEDIKDEVKLERNQTVCSQETKTSASDP